MFSTISLWLARAMCALYINVRIDTCSRPTALSKPVRDDTSRVQIERVWRCHDQQRMGRTLLRLCRGTSLLLSSPSINLSSLLVTWSIVFVLEQTLAKVSRPETDREDDRYSVQKYVDHGVLPVRRSFINVLVTPQLSSPQANAHRLVARTEETCRALSCQTGRSYPCLFSPGP
jgi:hypothetical protein